ncbi:MAG: phosphoribosylformylglycinamidine synthase subunit PurL [Methanosarcinaceae archaeon]|nr:phosphoribosylformylglycinamidine synthase subunit PurL [Methanosarcinaceae archaeon]
MLSEQDFKTVTKAIGREPNVLEQGIFQNMWSEHCSYRSSGNLLKNFSSKSENVIIGPGDDAAVVKFDDEYVISIAMESHNHPSYIEPFAGAATGVGGIVRDIISMGTRPVALMTPLYLGPMSSPKNVWLFENILKGAADYAEIINVPVIQGESYFHEGYSGNPLVNVVAVGLGKHENIMTSVSKEAGNRLVLFGKETGRDGLGGASFASKTMSEDDAPSESSIPAGDPEIEARVIEATLEAIEAGLFQSCRDLGAAGLAGATSELAGKNGKFGAIVNIDAVPLKEENMDAYEIMLSESQERMLAEVRPEDMEKVLDIMKKYDVPASDVGFLTEEKSYKIVFKGETVADLPIDLVTNGVPHAILTGKKPEKKTAEKTAETADETTADEATAETVLSKPECKSVKDTLLSLLASENFASKNLVWAYFESDDEKSELYKCVITEPTEDAGVIKITKKEGLAMSCGCEPGLGLIDPYTAASITIIENALDLAVKGALPLCAVDNLNFGNPYDPESYWVLEQSVLGLAETCKHLEIPVVGGNVSLYNVSEEFNTTIPPTPSIGMVGKTNIEKELPSSFFKEEGETVLLIGITKPDMAGSEYYNLNGFSESGTIPQVPENYKEIVEGIAKAAASGYLSSAHNISRGGLGIALSEMVTNIGAEIDLSGYVEFCLDSYKAGDPEKPKNIAPEDLLFSESPARAILTTKTPEKVVELLGNVACTEIGKTVKDSTLFINIKGEEINITENEIISARSTLEKFI